MIFRVKYKKESVAEAHRMMDCDYVFERQNYLWCILARAVSDESERKINGIRSRIKTKTLDNNKLITEMEQISVFSFKFSTITL